MDDKSKLTAERLRTARDKKQWSYGMLSNATGFSKSTLQRYETGFVQNVPVERLKIIGAALGVRPEWLMGFDEPKKEALPSLTEEQQNALELYSQLDPIDRAEIRGAMKQMLKADKYKSEQPRNIVKIAARNGQFEERPLSDSEIEDLLNLPDVDEF